MSMSCEDGEPVVVENRCIRRARKQHTCCACKRTIEPGQLYAYNFLVWDGIGTTYRRCGACEITWRHLLALCEQHNEAITKERREYQAAWDEWCKAVQAGNSRHLERPVYPSDDERRYPDEELNCGLDYDDEWEGDPPPEIASLPFISSAEASALLEALR